MHGTPCVSPATVFSGQPFQHTVSFYITLAGHPCFAQVFYILRSTWRMSLYIMPSIITKSVTTLQPLYTLYTCSLPLSELGLRGLGQYTVTALNAWPTSSLNAHYPLCSFCQCRQECGTVHTTNSLPVHSSCTTTAACIETRVFHLLGISLGCACCFGASCPLYQGDLYTLPALYVLPALSSSQSSAYVLG